MKIFIGSDHAGFELKGKLVEYLKLKGHTVVDFGAKSLDSADDYPDFVIPVALSVSKELDTAGVILGGSGQGEAMAANHIPRIRALVYYGGSTDIIKASRKDNDSNIISLGARFITEGEAKEAVLTFLETPFSGEARHKRRINKITNIKF